MSKNLAFIEFTPKEKPDNGKCIWCKKLGKTNKAHIFSKRIIKANVPLNILKKTVCYECNSKIGDNLEDFLFRMTPISYIADSIFQRELKSLKWIPNYFWSSDLGIWILCIHDKDAGKDLLPIQLMIDNDSQVRLFIEEDTALQKGNVFSSMVFSDVKSGRYTTHVAEYPSNFFPRAFYLKERLILTAKSEEEINLLKRIINNQREETNYEIRLTGSLNIKNYCIQFKWDAKSYYDYCGKIAFELFSLIKGAKAASHSGFDRLRESIQYYKPINPKDFTFPGSNDQRLTTPKLLPEGWFSYVPAHASGQIYPVQDEHPPDLHSVCIYELLNGLVCATVGLFNLPVAQIILGHQNQPNKFNGWRVHYDLKDSKMSFFELVTDPIQLKELWEEVKDKVPNNMTFTDQSSIFWLNNLAPGSL